jgi:flagellum-specific peptidoglycan hydrolase FlgJ
MTSSFQPQARPVDTFVQQSRVAAVNTQDSFGQLASALSIINPSLRKMLESEIDKQRGIIGAEAEQAAKEIYDPTSPNYVNLYNQAVDQQFPEEAELDNTEEEWGKRLDNVSKTVNPTEAQILAGRTPWFKHNFSKTKATLLGQSYAQQLQTSFLTDTGVDEVSGETRPISSFPFTNSTFQNWLAGKRSTYIEKLDVKPYYFNKYFVPELDKGHDAIHTLSNTEYPKQLFENYKVINSENMKSNIADYYLLRPQGATEEVVQQNEANLRAKILKQNTEIRRLFKGENYNKILEQQVDTLIDAATSIALSGDVDGARALLNNMADYFPTNDKGTSTLTSHPAFTKKANKFEKMLLTLQEEIEEKNEKLEERQMEDDGLAILRNPDSTDEDVVEYYKRYPTEAAKEFLNNQVTVIRPEKYDEYDDIEDKVLFNEYNTKKEATRAARSWYNSSLQLPKQREQFKELIKFIDDNYDGELTTLGQGVTIIEDAINDQFVQFDGKEFKDAADGRRRDDFRIEGKKQLKEWYKENPTASKQELIDEADAIADRQIEKARAYILSVEGIDIEQYNEKKTKGQIFLFERIADRMEMGSDGQKPTVEEVVEQYKEYGDVTVGDILDNYAKVGMIPKHFTITEDQQASINQAREKYGKLVSPTNTSVSGLEPSGMFEGINKSKPNDQLNESTNQDTPARPDTITNPSELNLSEVQSDMTPNLGLRDGSLLAMALPFKGKENKKQEDTKVTISKENNAVQRMETNFKTIYKLAKEVGVKFPEVVAAQFGVESDHGLQVTGKNNYFGIKATQAEIDAGQSTLAPTFEEVDGKKVRVMAHFKNFDTVKQSIEHYKKFWNDDFQDRKGTVNVDTAEEAIIRLKENGYATDSDYVKLVTDVLNDARREPKLF